MASTSSPTLIQPKAGKKKSETRKGFAGWRWYWKEEKGNPVLYGTQNPKKANIKVEFKDKAQAKSFVEFISSDLESRF